jgi:hypothetical protein
VYLLAINDIQTKRPDTQPRESPKRGVICGPTLGKKRYNSAIKPAIEIALGVPQEAGKECPESRC